MKTHERYRAKNVVIYSSNVPAEAKEAYRRPRHPQDRAKPMGRKGPIRFFAHARFVRSTSDYMVYSSYNGLNGFAEMFYGKGWEHIISPGLIGLCPSNVPAEAKEAYRRPWHPQDRAKANGAKGPHSLFFANARFVRSTSDYMVFSSYNGLNGFAEMFYGKGCEHIISPRLIGLCPSNVPTEAKEAYRRPWHPRDRAKAHRTKRSYALFPAAHDFQCYNHDLNWIT